MDIHSQLEQISVGKPPVMMGGIMIILMLLNQWLLLNSFFLPLGELIIKIFP